MQKYNQINNCYNGWFKPLSISIFKDIFDLLLKNIQLTNLKHIFTFIVCLQGVAPSPTSWCSSYWKGEPTGHPRLWLPTLLTYKYELPVKKISNVAGQSLVNCYVSLLKLLQWAKIWGGCCGLHRQHLCRGVRPPLLERSGYDTKQSDGEALIILELWRKRSVPSLPLLPCPLWIRVVAPDKGPICESNRTVWHLNCTYSKVNCLK